MKKILILSYNFAPRQTVGAIRPTKLAHALKKSGNIVDVVTVKPFGQADHSFDAALSELDDIRYIDKVIMPESVAPLSPRSAVSKPASASKKKTLKRMIKTEGREVLKIIRSKEFAREFEKMVKADFDKYNSYDAVFSTYGPIASHLCGLVMKKYCPKVRWIADFRDPMVVNLTTPLTKGYRGCLQNKVCKRADRLVAVSNGYYERIFGNRYKHKASVIYNGFDRSDIDFSKVVPDSEFSFTYVGALYDGKRDLRPLFDVLKELCDEKKIDRNDIHINYGGKQIDVISRQAAEYGMEDRITDHGMMARKDCLKLQARSRHLIHSTWNEKGENGVFPGKFLEYIMMERSIISLVAGDVPNSEVTIVVKRAGLGVTYEEPTADRDRASLKEYVYNDYLAYKRGEQPQLAVNRAETERFDFVNAAKQIEELM